MSRIEEFFEKSVDAGIIPQIPMNYDAVSYKIYTGYLENKIDELTAEVTELRARLEKVVELQFSNGDEVYAIMDTLLYTGVIPVTIKSADVVYEVFDGEQITTQHRTRIFATRVEAEARLKELQGGER